MITKLMLKETYSVTCAVYGHHTQHQKQKLYFGGKLSTVSLPGCLPVTLQQILECCL